MSKLEETKEVVENDWGKRAKNSNIKDEIDRVKKDYGKDFKNLYTRKMKTIKNKANGSTIVIMQFNVLADGLSGLYEPDDAAKVFCAVPKQCLYWSYRGARILEEINNVDPDVITFEELDQYEYINHFLKAKYDSRCQVNAKSPCLKVGEKFNHKLLPDGVAIFFKKDKFTPIEFLEFEGNKPIEIAALVVHLEEKKTSKRLLVAVLHLKSAKDTPGEQIRLKQLARFLPHMKKYQEEKEKELKKTVPLFIGCDLNGPPVRGVKNFEPFAYASIVSAETMNSLFDAHNKNVGKDEDKLEPKQFGYSDRWGVNLSSAYSDALKAEPEYTSWKKRKDGTDKYTVDYIFYQKNKNVSLLSYLDIPTESEVNQTTLLPGWEYPSDHFSIAAAFEF